MERLEYYSPRLGYEVRRKSQTSAGSSMRNYVRRTPLDKLRTWRLCTSTLGRRCVSYVLRAFNNSLLCVVHSRILNLACLFCVYNQFSKGDSQTMCKGAFDDALQGMFICTHSFKQLYSEMLKRSHEQQSTTKLKHTSQESQPSTTAYSNPTLIAVKAQSMNPAFVSRMF